MLGRLQQELRDAYGAENAQRVMQTIIVTSGGIIIAETAAQARECVRTIAG